MSVADVKPSSKTSFQLPSMHKVLLHNDDFTPIDFVVAVLTDIFDKDTNEAMDLAMTVHNEDRAIVGVYTKEIAETKVMMAKTAARHHGHPLLTTSEPM